MSQTDYTTLEETVLLFWDTKENYNKEITQQKLIPEIYKEVILIENLQMMKDAMERPFPTDQKFLFFVHLDHSAANKGLDSFKASKIKREYPNLAFYCVSSTSKSVIYEGEKNNSIDVFSYDTIHTDVDSRFIRQTKAQITGKEVIAKSESENEPDRQYPQCDYAILVALWDDEFTQVKEAFDWDGTVSTETKVYQIGHVKGLPEKRIVAASTTSTGMVDSAIIATQMMELFKPKFLFMTGVCGGVPALEYGSIIVAEKIFMFQKGKISDLRTKKGDKIILFDEHKNTVDLDHLYDQDGKQVHLSVEKFAVEHDSMPTLDHKILDQIRTKKDDFTERINKQLNLLPGEHKPISVELKTLACSTMVIDKEGYFDERIKPIDRKVVGIEMESYAVARACQFANNGKTKWIILKAVMDNTTEKTDKYKKLAAYTSAQFVKLMLENNVL